jgi:hypothetical protein
MEVRTMIGRVGRNPCQQLRGLVHSQKVVLMEEESRTPRDETKIAAIKQVATVTAFVTVGFSNARNPRGNRTASMGMGQEADRKFKMADSKWVREAGKELESSDKWRVMSDE